VGSLGVKRRSLAGSGGGVSVSATGAVTSGSAGAGSTAGGSAVAAGGAFCVEASAVVRFGVVARGREPLAERRDPPLALRARDPDRADAARAGRRAGLR